MHSEAQNRNSACGRKGRAGLLVPGLPLTQSGEAPGGTDMLWEEAGEVPGLEDKSEHTAGEWPYRG